MLRYSPRVQELALKGDGFSHKILESVWFRTTVLFPNLRKLKWSCSQPGPLILIRLLLSPSLVDLCVWLSVAYGNHTSVLGFLESHHTLCPNLKSLQFHSALDTRGLTTVVSRAICRFTNLEVLECDHIDEAALTHVSQSRCLRRFTSHHFYLQPGGWERIAGYGTPDHPPFENLRALKLKLGDLSSFIPCLKSHSQPFEEVSFDIRSFAPPEVIHELFTALCSVTRRATLRHITLFVPTVTVEEAEESTYRADFQVLSPLATLNLHELDINIGIPISLNDDELVRLVQGWPHLECLNLNQHGVWYFVPSLRFPTLRGLVLVLARCPRLYELGMSFDATSIPSLSDEEALIRNTAITMLSVSASPIRWPAIVAHFLLEHLPSLVNVEKWLSSCMWTNVDPVNARTNWLALERMWRKVEWHIRRIRGLEHSGPESSESEIGAGSSMNKNLARWVNADVEERDN